MKKRNKKKLIAFSLACVLLIAFSVVAVFADLPVASSAVTSVSYLLNRDDLQILCTGLLAQLDLQVPFGLYDSRLFFLTLSVNEDGSYTYHAYTQMSTGMYNCWIDAVILSDSSATGVDLGMYVSLSGSCTGSKHYVNMSLAGGIGKSDGTIYYNKTVTLNDGTSEKYCYKLPDNEILLCSSTSSESFTVYDSDYIGSYLSESAGSVIQNIRSMSQSWIDARDVKRDGLAAYTGSSSESSEDSSEVYSEAYSIGYHDGYNAGEIAGYVTGSAEGKKIGYNNGYANGLSDGLETATEEYNRGFVDGNAAGMDSGYKNGYTVGYKEGETVGYKSGYSAGSAAGGGDAVELDIPDIINSIPSAVQNFIFSGFGFEVFGINVAGLMSVLIILILVVFFIKRFKS